ncbi:unnamed protein product [Cyclocybe aegerita]|uniref:Cytochrome P450 n=1 Tax=Cyclocybe aegerita TaxID=1973307 RepID=A0A8S0X0Y1_CYCAE|nr:unnamed protein product [Cyclocybe aegerita]
MAPVSVQLLASVGAVVLASTLFQKLVKKTDRRLPGPPTIPLLGNALNFPRSKPWIQFLEWSREYKSDAIQLEVLGNRIIILNTIEATQELFVKRGLNYSSRPHIPILDIVGRSIDWLFLNYTADRVWRDHRKVYHREFDTQTVLHRPYETSATKVLLKKLYSNPNDFVDHLRATTGEAILGTTYGISVQPKDDPLLAIVNKFVASLDNAMGANAIVNVFPALRHLPRWVPGLQFYPIADELRKSSIDMPEIPLGHVRQLMKEGTAPPSVALRALEALEETKDSPDYPHDMRVLQNVLAGIYAAGADTTLTAMRWFFFTMIKFPHVQAKARAHIDHQTEGKRLPDFGSDFGSLPYIEAVLNEVLRFFPVLPIGMPHCVVEDDVYNDCLIKKDTIVFGNSWAIMRDEKIYGPDTHVFKPERFLNEDGSRNMAIPDPDQAFGYGRRVCAGKNVAREFLWLMMASILSSFEISQGVGENGKLVEPDADHHSSGLVCHPLAFPAKIVIRSEHAKELLFNTD